MATAVETASGSGEHLYVRSHGLFDGDIPEFLRNCGFPGRINRDYDPERNKETIIVPNFMNPEDPIHIPCGMGRAEVFGTALQTAFLNIVQDLYRLDTGFHTKKGDILVEYNSKRINLELSLRRDLASSGFECEAVEQYRKPPQIRIREAGEITAFTLDTASVYADAHQKALQLETGKARVIFIKVDDGKDVYYKFVERSDIDQKPDFPESFYAGQLSKAFGEAQARVNRYIEEKEEQHTIEHNKLAGLARQYCQRMIDKHLKTIRSGFSDIPEIEAYLNNVTREILNDEEFLALFVPELVPENFRIPREELNLTQIADNLFFRIGPNVTPVSSSEEKPIVIFNDIAKTNLREGLLGGVKDAPPETPYHQRITPGALYAARGGALIIPNPHRLLTQEGLELLMRLIGNENNPSGVKFVVMDREPVDTWEDPGILLRYLRENYKGAMTRMVVTHYDPYVRASKENMELIAGSLLCMIRNEKLLPLHPSAIRRIIEYGMFRADSQNLIYVDRPLFRDLLIRSHDLANRQGDPQITEEHINLALANADKIHGETREVVLSLYREGQISLVTAQNAVPGQINVPGVWENPGNKFHPRWVSIGRVVVTARANPGGNQEISLANQRAGQAGPGLIKSVADAEGWLAYRFPESPTPAEIHLSYGDFFTRAVDGPSYSAPTAAAIPSSIGNFPLSLSGYSKAEIFIFAFTGEIDPGGKIGSIGDVTLKIVDAFDCMKAMANEQPFVGAILIPKSNADNGNVCLNIRDDIVRAIENGLAMTTGEQTSAADKENVFFIFPVKNMDEALYLISGLPPAEVDKAVHRAALRFNLETTAIIGPVLNMIRRLKRR